MKFTQDEKEQIAEMIASEQWNLAVKAVSIMVERFKVKVLTTNVDTTGRDIVLRKAKLEAAIEIQRYMDAIRNEIKKEGLDG